MAVARTDALQAGRDAFSAGKTLDDCPYTNPDLAAAWRAKQAARAGVTTSLGHCSAANAKALNGLSGSQAQVSTD
jgi:hypothetical protein